MELRDGRDKGEGAYEFCGTTSRQAVFPCKIGRITFITGYKELEDKQLTENVTAIFRETGVNVSWVQRSGSTKHGLFTDEDEDIDPFRIE